MRPALDKYLNKRFVIFRCSQTLEGKSSSHGMPTNLKTQNDAQDEVLTHINIIFLSSPGPNPKLSPQTPYHKGAGLAVLALDSGLQINSTINIDTAELQYI